MSDIKLTEIERIIDSSTPQTIATMILKLRQDRNRLREAIISMSQDCPNCNNTGIIPVGSNEDGWEPSQCEFCYTVPYSKFNAQIAIGEKDD